MYLQSEYIVCIPDKISICSNGAAWNLWVMMTFHHRMPAWNRWVMMTFHHRTPASIWWVTMRYKQKMSEVGMVIVKSQWQGGAVNPHLRVERVFWRLSHVKRLQAVPLFPVLAYNLHRACSSGLRLLCFCLVTFRETSRFGFVFSDTFVPVCSSVRFAVCVSDIQWKGFWRSKQLNFSFICFRVYRRSR